MEIKTCEEYVLNLLTDTQNENEELTRKFNKLKMFVEDNFAPVVEQSSGGINRVVFLRSTSVYEYDKKYYEFIKDLFESKEDVNG